MKARFFALVALVLGMVSCQSDFETANPVVGGEEVDFQLSVDAFALATRAGDNGVTPDGQAELNSAFGAIDYLQGGVAGDQKRLDWSDVNLRYILEVYDVDDKGNVIGDTPVKDRMVKVVDQYESVVFDLRLIPQRTYRFVVFADFVGNNGVSKHHDIGSTLADITIKDDAINDESTDAYFAFEDLEIKNSATQTIVLKRPYGKLRVVATDLAELNLNVDPKQVVVTYEETHPTKFNAVTGTVEVDVLNVTKRFDTTFNEGVGKEDLANHFYTMGYDNKDPYSVPSATDATKLRHTHITLFTDYILAEAEGQSSVHFTMDVIDGKGKSIKFTEFVTEIPIERNHLTTVIGNVMTTASDINVSINDNFEQPERTVLETLVNGGEFTLTEDLVITEPTTLVGNATINLNGKTLTYAPAGDDTRYAIMTRVANGASLTFVGDGEVISEGYVASANEGGTIYVKGGKYTVNSSTIFQANGGRVYVEAGEFKAAPYEVNGVTDYRYTLNHMDSMKSVGLIEVTGGKFYKYNPAQSASENPVMSFVPAGYSSTLEGDYYVVRAL